MEELNYPPRLYIYSSEYSDSKDSNSTAIASNIRDNLSLSVFEVKDEDYRQSYITFLRDYFFFHPHEKVYLSGSDYYSKKIDVINRESSLTFSDGYVEGLNLFKVEGYQENEIVQLDVDVAFGNFIYNHTTNQGYLGGRKDWDSLVKDAEQLQELFGFEVIPIKFSHETFIGGVFEQEQEIFYHLDLMMNVMPNGEVLVYEGAFDNISNQSLKKIRNDLVDPENGWIEVNRYDALNYSPTNFISFGNNIFSPGSTNLLPEETNGNLLNLSEKLEERGYNVIDAFEMLPNIEFTRRTYRSAGRGAMVYSLDMAGLRCISNYKAMSCEEFLGYKYKEFVKLSENGELDKNPFFARARELAFENGFNSKENEILNVMDFLASKSGYNSFNISKNGTYFRVSKNGQNYIFGIKGIQLVDDAKVLDQEAKNMMADILQTLSDRDLYIKPGNMELQDASRRMNRRYEYTEVSQSLNQLFRDIIRDEQIDPNEKLKIENINEILNSNNSSSEIAIKLKEEIEGFYR